ncbi:MAG: NAD-dependent epimerase/dehydratase family protein [Caldilineaceae bacterium SB0666_bin_21]|nr:NAD-dependent epimerase/dehydratase family protein [Caldilineaceae bacterium SB0666_bin_21]
MRALVTGGAGFVGLHLANRLHALGWPVQVLDDLSNGQPEFLDRDIPLQEGDVNDLPLLWRLLKNVDVVFHLAALANVPESVHYPRAYNTVNTGGTVALLEACRDVGVRRVILASSATVYGAQSRQPVSEDVPLKPGVPYAVSKVAAENYLFSIAGLNGFEAVALRIFNTYGPWQPVPHAHAPVIPRFMHDTLNRRSVVIFGDGHQTRDFIYIDDVVRALVLAAEMPGIHGHVLNIGSGCETTINELVGLIGKTVGCKPHVLHNQDTAAGVSRLVADMSKARRVLDFKPRVSLRDGLQRFHELEPAFQG